MKFIKKLTSYPMKCIEQCRFVDFLTGKSVGLYEDRSGIRWLAEGRWSLFRVLADRESGADLQSIAHLDNEL